jgi:hypothetical protein
LRLGWAALGILVVQGWQYISQSFCPIFSTTRSSS